MRWMLSLTASSGRPTRIVLGSAAQELSTSASTGTASMPTRAKVLSLASTGAAPGRLLLFLHRLLLQLPLLGAERGARDVAGGRLQGVGGRRLAGGAPVVVVAGGVGLALGRLVVGRGLGRLAGRGLTGRSLGGRRRGLRPADREDRVA